MMLHFYKMVQPIVELVLDHQTALCVNVLLFKAPKKY